MFTTFSFFLGLDLENSLIAQLDANLAVFKEEKEGVDVSTKCVWG